MYQSISGLLNNILFVTFPLFLYQLFFIQNKKINIFKNDKFFLILMFSLSILFCMLFPYQVLLTKAYHFDLRQVPVIIGTLYGGYNVGFWLFLVSSFLRIPLGGDGLYIAIINQFAIFALVPLLQKKYFQLSIYNRVLVCIMISVLSLAFNMIVGWGLFNDQVLPVLDAWIFLIINQSIFVALTAMIMERIIKNNYIKQTLIRNERLEIVSHLSASISHEIRNPLQVISGFIQLLKSTECSKEKRGEYYDYILDEVQSAERIISDYLMFAKPTFEKVEVFNVLDEIDNTINIIHSYASKSSVAINRDFCSTPCFIEADRQKFKQCIVNIARNCIDAMELQGGLLTFQVLQPEDYHITIQISDMGKGMTKEEIIRLGEPYFSTKENGTGLGMMVVFSIIKNMNGTIKVKSEVGKGSTFMIKIPMKCNVNN